MNLTTLVWARAQDLENANPLWRAGQCVFNALEEADRDVANLVRGQVFDPFYNDAALPDFWTWLAGREA